MICVPGFLSARLLFLTGEVKTNLFVRSAILMPKNHNIACWKKYRSALISFFDALMNSRGALIKYLLTSLFFCGYLHLRFGFSVNRFGVTVHGNPKPGT